MVTDFISIASGVILIVLAIYAIWFAKKESQQSSENYLKTKDLLKEIEHKTELIDRGIQFEQEFLMKIVNKLLEKSGKEQVSTSPLSIEDINSLIDGKSDQARERIEKLEKAVNNIPKIHISKEPPKTLRDGEIWFQYE